MLDVCVRGRKMLCVVTRMFYIVDPMKEEGERECGMISYNCMF